MSHHHQGTHPGILEELQKQKNLMIQKHKGLKDNMPKGLTEPQEQLSGTFYYE